MCLCENYVKEHQPVEKNKDSACIDGFLAGIFYYFIILNNKKYQPESHLYKH